MGGPFDIAVPFAREDADRELLQVLGHRALEAQLSAHRGEKARGFGIVEERAELQADFRRIAVLPDAVVNRLPFGVHVFTVYVRYSCHGLSSLIAAPHPNPLPVPGARGHFDPTGRVCLSGGPGSYLLARPCLRHRRSPGPLRPSGPAGA